MNSPARRSELARLGRARVISHHTWDSSMRRMDEIIERAVNESSDVCELQTI
jgi:hypothetical protein